MAVVSPLPINVNQDIENVEFDIREYLSPGSPGSADKDNLGRITAAKIIEAALNYQTAQFNSRFDTMIEHLSTISQQTTIIAQKQTIIADYIANISTQTTTIATSSTIIASSSTIIAQKHTDIEEHQKRMLELAEGSGMHVVGPYEIFGMINQYKTMIEQGGILDFGDVKSKAKTQHALDVMNDYAAKIRRNIPREWG